MDEMERTSEVMHVCDRDDNEVLPLPEETAAVQNSKAMDAITTLQDYCRQQQVTSEFSSIVDVLDLRLRKVQFEHAKQSPPFLHFFKYLTKRLKENIIIIIIIIISIT